MECTFKTLDLSCPHPAVMQVTLSRPSVHNALNSEMMRELRDFWSDTYLTYREIRCIVLTGMGDKAFCAGADLKERNAMTTESWNAQHAMLEQAMLAMSACPIPVIAAVNGVAYGGGLELLLACDFAYATDTATFAFPETRIGIIPGAMGTQRLPAACGLRRAKEICYTGKTFSAVEALEWGIVNKLCDAGQLLDRCLDTATVIGSNAPLAVRQVKRALKAAGEADIERGYHFEIEAYNRLIPTQDREEGVRAFNEKRSPVFSGT